MPQVVKSLRTAAALGASTLPFLTGASASEDQFCSFKEIPAEAAALATHGANLRIFPSAQAIDAAFSGCQNVWLADGFLLAQATYRRGEVVQYIGNNPDGSRSVSCLYEERRLVLATGDCPSFEAFPLNKPGRTR